MNSGYSIPQLGLGLWQVPPNEVRALVDVAVDVGYRHFDTAASYGNEAQLGEALSHSAVPREDLFVSTKLWNTHHGYDATMRAFDASVSALRVQYVDLYMIHWPVPGRNMFIESWRAMQVLRDEGRIRTLGVSNFRDDDLRAIAADGEARPAVNQVELHPEFQNRTASQATLSNGTLVEAWAPLGQGTSLVQNEIRRIAARVRCTPAQVVLAWHLTRGRIVVPKTRTYARLKENYESPRVALSNHDLLMLDGLDRGESARLGPDPSNFFLP